MFVFFFQAEDGIRDYKVTGVQTCALPILANGTYAYESVLWRDPDTGETVTIGEGVITAAEQARIIRLLAERTEHSGPDMRRRGKRAQPQHLLTGMTRCGSCGSRLGVNGRSYCCLDRLAGKICPAPA